ncbi:zinc finger, CCHC-type containing protein [Tanacetum coccineum]
MTILQQSWVMVIIRLGMHDDEESNHEDASDTGNAPKQQQQVIPQTTAISNIKLPILKKEEYDIWAMEMEHYLEYIKMKVGRERTRLHLFQFSLHDQASNWLERLPAGSITTWEDLNTPFLAPFFSPGRTTKLRNDILMFQQRHGESLSKAWTRFKDLL